MISPAFSLTASMLSSFSSHTEFLAEANALCKHITTTSKIVFFTSICSITFVAIGVIYFWFIRHFEWWDIAAWYKYIHFIADKVIHLSAERLLILSAVKPFTGTWQIYLTHFKNNILYILKNVTLYFGQTIFSCKCTNK